MVLRISLLASTTLLLKIDVGFGPWIGLVLLESRGKLNFNGSYCLQGGEITSTHGSRLK